ncbi:MAG: NIPSNAP family containing protein [Alphaproteobacteria bacterium]|nr:NIPSNAP family containing protein [Alphaproteobacteria bacterium]
MAFYELRQYKVLPGKMAEWIRVMEQEVIPFQVSKGMVITGSFRGEQDESAYVWMRRFESEEERKRLYAAVYESDHWKSDISPRVPSYIDRSGTVVTRIVPTGLSTTQ